MSKDLSKVKAGDFVRFNSTFSISWEFGIVLQMSGGGLMILTQEPRSMREPKAAYTHQTLIFEGSDSKFISKHFEFRRLPKEMSNNSYYYLPKNWQDSYYKGEPIFPTIEIKVEINGKEAKLSDISEETLIKLRNEN